MSHDWHAMTCIRYQPFISLLSFVATYAVLAGNKYRTPSSGKLNPYLLILGQTTVGKDNPIQLCKTLMRKLNRKSMVGPAQIGSDAGLLTVMSKSPTSVIFNDEFNFLLKQMSGDRAASYTRGIMSVMSEMSNGGDYDGRALKAGADETVIVDPFLSMAFYAQPAGFFDLMDRGAIDQGFFNRLLVYKAAIIRREPFKEFVPSPDDALPLEIMNYCRSALGDDNINQKLAKWVFPGQNKIGVHQFHLSPDAKVVWEAYWDHNEARREKLLIEDSEDVTLSLTGRALQNAYRLACICAWSRSYNSTLLLPSDVEWAIRMTQLSEDTYAECPHLTKVHEDFIKKCGAVLQFLEREPRGVLRSKLSKHFPMKEFERQDVIKQLTQQRSIMQFVTEGRGIKYVHAKYLTKEQLDSMPE